MISFGNSVIAPYGRVSNPQFNIAIENKGQIGHDSFELWLSLENNSEDDVTFTSGFVSFWLHYGNWVAGLRLQTTDALPTELKAGRTISCCLHQGNSLPVPLDDRIGWKHGESDLKKLDYYADLLDLMEDNQIEFEAHFRFQTDRLKHPNFLKEWFASRKPGNQKINRILSVSSQLARFQKVPTTVTSTERYG